MLSDYAFQHADGVAVDSDFAKAELASANGYFESADLPMKLSRHVGEEVADNLHFGAIGHRLGALDAELIF